MILTKTSKQEQVSNTNLIHQFEHAFVTGNMVQLKELLHDNGLFIGKRSKTKLLAMWYQLFRSPEGILFHLHAHANRGYSRFGEEVLEIRMSTDMIFGPDGFPVFPTFGAVANPKLDERIFRFTFRFRDGKIIGISQPKEFSANVDQLTECN